MSKLPYCPISGLKRICQGEPCPLWWICSGKIVNAYEETIKEKNRLLNICFESRKVLMQKFDKANRELEELKEGK